MRKFILLFVAFIGFSMQVLCQNLIITGRIRCLNQAGTNSSRGAQNIIVIPGSDPSRSTITADNPQGYFEINTGQDLSVFLNKTVKLYIVSKCDDCNFQTKPFFISNDKIKINTEKNVGYAQVPRWTINAVCSSVELPAFTADSMLNVITTERPKKKISLTTAGALVAPTAFLNTLTQATVASTIITEGIFMADTLLEPRFEYGSLLFSSAMVHSSNIGFNFAPSRDLSEAVFWNPAALAFSKSAFQVSTFTNLRNSGRAAISARIGKRINIGIGGLINRLDGYRRTTYVKLSDDPFGGDARDSRTARHLEKLEEYALYFSPSFKLSRKLGLGVSIKSVYQKFNQPKYFIIERGVPDDNGETEVTNIFTDIDTSKRVYDADFSINYNVSPSFQIGLNLMNLLGSKLFADNFIEVSSDWVNDFGEVYVDFSEQKKIEQRNLRSAGLGMNYKLGRLNLGSDILVTEKGLYDATVGASYVPLNNVQVSGGYAMKHKSYMLGVKFKYFKLYYVEDNGTLINESKEAKSKLLDGRIFSGFSINF